MTQPTGEQKKRLFSGIQPSGTITLGNYMGAIRNWVAMQDDYECIFCVVDQHAITVRQQPADLRRNTLQLLALYLACGLDPQNCTLFVQSHVPEHAQLAWVLSCITGMGELQRMTQFKDKSKKQESVYTGLFTYPTLMAADILLYQTDLVPVGEDQKQHVELTRDLAIRFNSAYSPTFKVPDVVIPKTGARIRSLTDPTRKMSKSDEEASYIALSDTPEAIRRKFRRAVTDSDAEIRYDPQNKPGVSNLLTIYAAVCEKTVEQAAQELQGGGYGQLKDCVADAVIAKLSPIQEEFKRIIADKNYLDQVMADGAQRAHSIARRTLSTVYRKVGFVQPK